MFFCQLTTCPIKIFQFIFTRDVIFIFRYKQWVHPNNLNEKENKDRI